MVFRKVKEKQDKTSNGKKSGKSRFLIIVLVLALVVVAVGGYYGYPVFKQRRTVAKAVAVAPQLQHTLDLGGMVVNLNGSTNRYLRVNPVVVINYESEKKLEKELEEKKYQVKDALIILLRDKSIYEVSTAQGVESLKEQVAAVINEVLESGQVEEVYFTEFLLQ